MNKNSNKKRKPQEIDSQNTHISPICRSPAPYFQSPNSNSLSIAFDTYYPRTPIRKLQVGKMADQLAQVIQKGLTDYVIVFIYLQQVTQVSFNSNQSLQQLQLDFEGFQIYERKTKNLDWSLLYQKIEEAETYKNNTFETYLDLYDQFRTLRSHMMISSVQFLMMFAHDNNDPYALYIERYDGSSIVQTSAVRSKFLDDKGIQYTPVIVQKPMSTLFPNVATSGLQSYQICLIFKPYIQKLFNILMNIAIDKDSMDVAAPFKFFNSRHNVVQTFNGLEQSEQDNLFDNTSKEFKISYEGMFSLGQVKLIKDKYNLVVSSLKLNPLTTLFNADNFEVINKIQMAKYDQ